MIPQVQIPDFAGNILRGEQAQASRLQMLAMQEDMADQRGLRAAAGTPGLLDGSNPQAVGALLQYGPRGVQLAQTIQQRAEQQRGQIREQLPLIAGMLEGATPETYGDVRARALAAGLSPSVLPEAFDPNRIAGLTRAAQAIRQARIAEEVEKQNALLPGRMAVAAASRPSISVNAGQTFGQALGRSAGEGLERLLTQAQTGASAVTGAHRVLDLLDNGAITGPLAENRLTFERALAAVGLIDGQRVTNTEQLMSELARRVLSATSQMSGVLTDRDIEFLREAEGGRISLDARTIRRIAQLAEDGGRRSIDRFNSTATPLQDEPGLPEVVRRIYAPIPAPAARQPPQRPAARPQAVVPGPSGGPAEPPPPVSGVLRFDSNGNLIR